MVDKSKSLRPTEVVQLVLWRHIWCGSEQGYAFELWANETTLSSSCRGLHFWDKPYFAPHHSTDGHRRSHSVAHRLLFAKADARVILTVLFEPIEGKFGITRRLFSTVRNWTNSLVTKLKQRTAMLLNRGDTHRAEQEGRTSSWLSRPNRCQHTGTPIVSIFGDKFSWQRYRADRYRFPTELK